MKVRGAPADNRDVAAAGSGSDPVFEEQLAEARERQVRDLSGREAATRIASTLIAFAGATALPLLAAPDGGPAWWVYPAFGVAYALVSSIQIEVGSGVALPTELVFVPMLFMLPAALVPAVVLCAMLAAALVEAGRSPLSLARALVRPGNGSWFSFGPALVFLAAGGPRADWRGGLVLVGAVAAQFAGDWLASSLQERLALGISPRLLVRPLLTTFAIDALMVPVAFGVVVAQRVQPGSVLLPIPLVLLLLLFARERRERLDSVLELSTAYRGTAFLLGDVVEADDTYTGRHSREVVELVSRVAERLRVDPHGLRLAEFTALLHDVGKIRIPGEILNKPAGLTAEERALIETHTLEGERLLLQVGGLLAEVGHLVRSCHEHWDGRGYPDGLAGAGIPLVARIVCCCDAYNAITTDRPYRAARTPAEAVAELQAHRGTQFDPDVVDALVAEVAPTLEPAREGGRADRALPRRELAPNAAAHLLQ